MTGRDARWITSGILLLLSFAYTNASAKDEPKFGLAIDAFCTAEGRDPATPYADGKSSFPTSECQLCHMPLTFDKTHVTEGFHQWKLATTPENLRPDGTPDFSWFCPLAQTMNRPPILEPIGGWTLDEGVPLAFLLHATDPDGDNLWFDAANLPTGAALVDHGDGSAEFSWTPTFEQSGNFDVTFIVSDDGAPTESDSEQVTFTVGNVNRPPVLAPIGDRSVAQGASLTLALAATDPDGDGLGFEAASLPIGAIFTDHGGGSAELVWTPGFDQSGNYAVTVIVTDDGSPMESDSERFTITVGDVNRPPQLDAIGNRMAKEGETLTVVLMASDPDGDAVAFSATGLPAGAGLADYGDGSAEMSWTPMSGDAGNYPVTFSVVDDGTPPEGDSEEVMITVAPADQPPANRPPVLDPVGDRTLQVGGTLSIALTASDPDGDGLGFAVEGLPAGAAFVDHEDGSAEVSWTPEAEAVGEHPLTCTVTDDGNPPESDAESIMVRVGAARSESLSVLRAKASRGRLLVKGRGGSGDVELMDHDSGTVLGSTKASGKGSFRLKLYVPTRMPCSVHVRDAASMSGPVSVEKCMEGSGADVGIRKAAWKSGRSLLEIKGIGGPYYGSVEIHDGDTGRSLGSTRADHRGKFRFRDHPDSPPCRVYVSSGDFVSAVASVEGADACGDEMGR